VGGGQPPEVLRHAARAGVGGPTLGQPTEEVLRDLLGYDDDCITELVVVGALQ
jgi:hypothetical protein